MGAAKSIAMTYSDRQYLLYYIDRKDYPNIEKMLEKRPDLLNHKLTQNTKMTPLYRASYNGDLEMVRFFVEKCHAQVNHPTEAGEIPLIAAAKRNHIRIVKYLLEHGGDFKFITPYGLAAIEFAILAGYYDIALMLYYRTQERIRTAEQYEQLGAQYHYRYVNYPMFLEFLQKKVDPENVPNFLKKHKKVYQDPVVDPRQTWKQWAKRQLQFKDPPLVERDDLPEELQPQNRKFGKMSTLMSGFVMSPLTQKPSYLPKTKSQIVESGDEMKIGQYTNEDIQIKTMP